MTAGKISATQQVIRRVAAPARTAASSDHHPAAFRRCADQVGSLRGPAGSASVHIQGGWIAKAARDSDLRRQGSATCRVDGAGGHLRTGLSALLVWLPTGSLGSPGT